MKGISTLFLLSTLVFPVFVHAELEVSGKDIDAKIFDFCTEKKATDSSVPNKYHCFCTIKTHFILTDATGKNLVLEALDNKTWEPLNKVMLKSVKEVPNVEFMPQFDKCFYSYCPDGFNSCK